MSNTWPMAKLGDLCEIQRGGSPRPIERFITDSCDGINWIKIGDVGEGEKYIVSTKQKIRPEGAQRSRFVKTGDFLLTNSMSFGRPYILRVSGCIHDGWLVLRYDQQRLTEDYLYHALSSDAVYEQFVKMASGAVVKNLNSDVVKKVEIPIPPLAEQRRIAAILDKADALRTKRREALAQLDRLAQSIFVEMFGDQRPSSLGSDCVTLGELVEVNPSITTLERQSLFNTKVAFLPMAAVSDTERRVIDYAIKSYDAVSKGYTSFKRGDLLVAKITPCYENGKMAVVGDLPTEYGFGSTEFHVFRPASIQLCLFVFYLLSQDWIAEAGAKSMKGAAGQRRVPADFFSSLRVENPGDRALEVFASRISKIEALKKTARHALNEANALFSSLQEQAFSGGI